MLFMNIKHEKFIKELIKGKIAEIIFEQMFRESGKFTILHYAVNAEEKSLIRHLYVRIVAIQFMLIQIPQKIPHQFRHQIQIKKYGRAIGA